MKVFSLARSGKALQKMFDVKLVNSQSDIPRELWEACFPPPLEGRWWYETLERSLLHEQFQFSYAVLIQESHPVGIAPLFFMQLPLDMIVPDSLLKVGAFIDKLSPTFLRPPTLFVGSPCSDEGHVGLMPGIDRRGALLCLQDTLKSYARAHRARILIWKDFPEDWNNDFGWLMKKRRLFRSVSYPGTVVDLASAVKEDYFSRLKTSRRQHLRRDLKLSSQRIDVHVEVVQRPDTSTLDELFALFMQTFIHAEIKFEQLNRQFFELISEQPVSYFILLRDGDSNRVVAFNLCFLMDTHVINKFIGIDRILPKNFLLLVRLWDTVLDWSLAHGAKTIQSGQTGYSTKIKTGHRLVPLNNYGQVFNVVFHALFRFVGERITWKNLDADLATAIAADPGIGIKTREAKDHVDVSEGGQTRKGNVEAGSRESSK